MAVDRCRHEGKATLVEARQFAEEMRASVIHKSEEVLAELASKREALQAEAEAKHREFSAREAAVATRLQEAPSAYCDRHTTTASTPQISHVPRCGRVAPRRVSRT